MNFVTYQNPPLELAEEAIMLKPWGDVHLIVGLPSTFSLLPASEVLAVNSQIL